MFIRNIKALLEKSPGEEITVAEKLHSFTGPTKLRKVPCVRRLSHFGDSEGKTRTIGILDYWSQTVLKPIHDLLMDLLDKIPEDCTSNQQSFISKLPKDGPYYSFDLTAATDRLPLNLQGEIIDMLIGCKRGNA